LTRYETVYILIPMGINQIGHLVKEACRERGLSLNRLALELGVNPIYLNNVIYGKKSSRPLIRRVAETLRLPHLTQVYEEYLKTKRENKGVKFTKKRGRKNKSCKRGVK